MERRPYDDGRVARRRALKQRRRRLWVGGAVAVLVGVAIASAIVLLADRSHAGRASSLDTAAPQSTVASFVSPAPASLSPSPAPSPSPTPTKPPLDKPTRKHPLRVYFGGDSLAGLPGVLFAQHGAKSGLMKVRTDYQVSSRLTSPDPGDWPAHRTAQMGAGHPDAGVFMIGINDPGMPMMLHEGAERVYWVGLPVMPERGQTN